MFLTIIYNMNNKFPVVFNKLVDLKLTRSMTHMSEDLLISRPTLSMIKSGERNISIDLINALYEKYSVNPNYFFLPDAPMFLDSKHQEATITQNDNDLKEQLQKCKENTQTLLNTIDVLTKSR